jgi:drug/metabolite transporter (DMT)-like permease
LQTSRSFRPVALCLGYLYIVWGTSYLANRYVLVGFPPLLAGGARFFVSGCLLATLAARGSPRPSRNQILGAALLGFLFLSIGSGCVVFAQQYVHSSLAAISVASVGLWTCVFSRFFGHTITTREWLGVCLGLTGVLLLNWEQNLQAHPKGALALVLGAMGWGLGTALARRLPQPQGILSSAVQMLSGGALLLLASGIRGESLTRWPPLQSWLAFFYLLVFASMLAFSAYNYLMQNVKPSLATSYIYVNPLLAVFLGRSLAGETLGEFALLGLLLILSALALVARRG